MKGPTGPFILMGTSTTTFAGFPVKTTNKYSQRGDGHENNQTNYPT